MRRARQDRIVRSKAKPWFARYWLSPESLQTARAAEGWHLRYGGDADGSQDASGSEWGY